MEQDCDSWEREVIHSPDLVNDDRWPAWGPRAVAELGGVRSLLCLQLFAAEEAVGVFNLYSKRVGAFASAVDHREAEALAAHAAVALVAAEEIAHLETAMGNRTVIGQAEAILMERFRIDAEKAFDVLRRVSMHSNVKLFTVASELVRTRTLPRVLS